MERQLRITPTVVHPSLKTSLTALPLLSPESQHNTLKLQQRSNHIWPILHLPHLFQPLHSGSHPLMSPFSVHCEKNKHFITWFLNLNSFLPYKWVWQLCNCHENMYGKEVKSLQQQKKSKTLIANFIYSVLDNVWSSCTGEWLSSPRMFLQFQSRYGMIERDLDKNKQIWEHCVQHVGGYTLM